MLAVHDMWVFAVVIVVVFVAVAAIHFKRIKFNQNILFNFKRILFLCFTYVFIPNIYSPTSIRFARWNLEKKNQSNRNNLQIYQNEHSNLRVDAKSKLI